MKFIAAINADFERSFLGLPARLDTELRGETVIRRTLRQLQRVAGIASIHLLVDASQESTARTAAAGLDVAVETHAAGKPPWHRYVASGRKWSLDSWRGGLAGATIYDEFNHPWLLSALARREQADAVIDVPAAAPLLDPALLEKLLQHYVKVHEQTRLAFVQSAPGLSAVIYQTQFLDGLAGVSQPPGQALTYRPEEPQADAIHQPCWFAAEAAIAHAAGRCVADTDSAVARLDRMMADLDISDPSATPDALTLSRWLHAHRHLAAHPVPMEVEIEITTADSLHASPLRPRGRALQRQAEMPFATFQRIIDDLARCDDRLIVLGGFGDPLLHPQWAEFVQYARKKGILGIALRTSGLDLDEPCIERLLACEPDVLNLLLDANTPETYKNLHNFDGFERVIANLEQLCSVQQQRQIPRPLIACEMIKVHQTMDELEAFYDRWIRRTASAVISGPSHFAGQWPDRAVVRMAPPTRARCARLPQRAMILADGRMTLCDQDFRGDHAVGSLEQTGLADLWQGPRLADLRQQHLAGAFLDLPLCRDCDEWHRP